MFGHFHNESLRKLVVAFGSLFNSIEVKRYNEDGSEKSTNRVPLTYAPKEKFVRRLEEQSGISDTTKIQTILPKMSFEMSSINYDPNRHLNKINTRVSRIDGSNPLVSFQEVPYNIGFSLYAYTRHMEDNLQIIEQILPYFTPEFLVTLNLNAIDTKLDVPIVLSNVAIQEQAEGNFLDRRIIASNFNFMCKTRVYGKIESEIPITDSGIDFFNDEVSSGSVGQTGSTDDYSSGGVVYEWI